MREFYKKKILNNVRIPKLSVFTSKHAFLSLAAAFLYVISIIVFPLSASAQTQNQNNLTQNGVPNALSCLELTFKRH
jgi:hypothetical protein